MKENVMTKLDRNFLGFFPLLLLKNYKKHICTRHIYDYTGILHFGRFMWQGLICNTCAISMHVQHTTHILEYQVHAWLKWTCSLLSCWHIFEKFVTFFFCGFAQLCYLYRSGEYLHWLFINGNFCPKDPYTRSIYLSSE